MKRRAIALFVLVALCLAWPGQGQTFVVDPAPRQGDFASPSVTIPGGSTLATVQFDIPNTSEYENPANSIEMWAEVSADGTTWRRYNGFGWVGNHFVNGKTGAVNTPPAVIFDLRPALLNGENRLRAHATIPNSITVGVTVILQ